MQRSIHSRPGLGTALRVVQTGGAPLWRVLVDWPSLIYVQAGRKTVRTTAGTFVAAAGEMLAVGAGSEIEVTNALPPAGPYAAFCVSFDPQVCAAVEGSLPAARVVAPVAALGRPPEYLLQAFHRAVAACECAAATPERIARHQLQEVLLGVELLGWRFDARGANRTAARIRRLLGAEPAQRWRIGAVGRLLGMSEATLRRRLDAEGVSFRTIIAQVRMTRALALLQSSELSVTEIAYAVGYESLSQFTAKFRRHYGQSPGQLRGTRGPATRH